MTDLENSIESKLTRYTVTEATVEGPRLALFTTDKEAARAAYAALLPNVMLTISTASEFREGATCLAEAMMISGVENETAIGWVPGRGLREDF